MNFFKKIRFKNKIFIKLVFYFGVSLLLFSIVTGFLFTYMYMRNTVNLNMKNLEKRAEKLSETLAHTWFSNDDGNRTFPNGSNNKDGPRRRNMRFIEDIAMAEVWIIEADTGNIIQSKKSRLDSDSYQTLPPNAEEAIKTALKGNLNTTENFSEFLDKNAITVAAPVLKGREVVGVVLLHSPVENISSALNNGIYTLIISILLALFLSGITSIVFSLNFTRPLNKIKNTALELSEGNYDAKTGVTLNDEIGDLARTVDFLALKLYKSSKESEHFEKMRQDFIINVSHELRTPVTVIRGSMEAICDGIISSEDKLKEYHQQILSDSIHLQKLINDLIDLSKLQNLDFSIEKNPFKLSEVIKDAIRSMRQPASKKNIEILVEGNEECDFVFSGDYHRIRQMIIIILDNAIKFSPEHRNINVFISDKNKKCKLDISNEGKGISYDSLDKIFDRFHKSEGDDNKNGMGLGLAIAKHIALRHDIKISVESIQNVRTVFSFDFPKNC